MYILVNILLSNIFFSDGRKLLTLNVRGPSYLGLTWSISWLLMPWLLTSPGHQEPWYWLYWICRFLSYFRKDFKYLCYTNVEEWHKMQIYVNIPSEKLALKGLIIIMLWITWWYRHDQVTHQYYMTCHLVIISALPTLISTHLVVISINLVIGYQEMEFMEPSGQMIRIDLTSNGTLE